MYKRLLLSILTLSAVHGTFAQRATPLGSMVVLPVSDPNISGEACWSDPNVLGVLLRVHWADIETSDGGYDWSYFSTGIGLATTNHKWLVFSVDGSQAPQWLYNEGVPMWTSSRSGNSAPYPWNSTLQSKWGAMITKMGSRYDAKNLVHAVTMWCGGTAIECFFAENQTDANALDQIAGGGAGSGATLWSNAAETLINQYLAAFPNTPLYLATGLCYPNSDATMTTVVNWFLPQRSGMNGAQSNALSYTYPSGNTFPHTTLQSSSLSPIMYQTLAPIGSSRMNGATLAQVISNGESENAKAIQVYPGDPATDETALAKFNTYVGAN